MRILPLNNNHQYYTKRSYTTPPRLSFKSNERQIFDNAGKIINRNVTYFFRSDLDWEEFAKYLKRKYLNTPKVNIYDYACSDGSEAYSLALSILAKGTPSENDKFFPIIAKDIDPYIIKKAQSGSCDIYDSDLYAINYYTKNKFNYFFQATAPKNKSCDLGIIPKEPLQNRIVFEQANIIKDLKNIPGKNNVILCRNFWPYLNETQQMILAEDLYQKSKNNGLIVIGDFDERNGIANLLTEVFNFKQGPLNRIYEPK